MNRISGKSSLRWFLREWRIRAGITQGQLAELCDTATAVVSLLETGKRPMQDHWIERASKALRIKPADLLRDPNAKEDQVARIPLVSLVSAGALQGTDGITDLSDCPLIEASGLPNGDWFALTVDGDSMDRISPPGSIIFVNRKDRVLVPKGLYVISDEAGAATYKRYRPSPDRFEPVSVNPSHEAIFPEGRVRVIGRVRRTILET